MVRKTKENEVLEQKNVVIYARYSSSNQTEASIEGQLKVCYEYAKQNNFNVVEEYIDRAMTGTNDNRPDFKRMMEDSKKHKFQGILVYQLDRFARNRYDSANNKAILKKNGVKVYSAKENISDDPSGILMESMLEGMAEYYSAELSQKIKRGMDLLADKCLYTGGGVALGFKINPDKTFGIDEETAPFVVKIFEKYASGEHIIDICDYLNSMGLKTSKKAMFNKCSLHTLLKNKRYIGTYTYNEMEIPNAIPRIISDELFNEVQERLKLNKNAPARAKAVEEYLLTGKMFCGACESLMSGISGTSKTGRKYTYYTCGRAKKGECDKKHISKNFIEDLAIAKCREVLTDKNIKKIAREIAEISELQQQSAELIRLRGLKDTVDKEIENLLRALESGVSVDLILARIQEKRNQRQEIEKSLYKEEYGKVVLSESQIVFFLQQLKNGNANNLKYRRMLIRVLLKAIYVYEDEIIFMFNVGEKTIQINEKLLSEIQNSDRSSSFKECPAPTKHTSTTLNCKVYGSVFCFLSPFSPDVLGVALNTIRSLIVFRDEIR